MTVDAQKVNLAFDDYIDTLGSYLEHKGFTDDDIDEYFLEHFGVKGMKWGTRTGRQKVAIAGVSAASYAIGSSFVMGMTMNPPLAIAAGAASAALGARFMNLLIDSD